VKRIEVLDWFDGCEGFIRRHQDYVDEKELQDVLLDESE